MTKETFWKNEAIAGGDFAKDYQFLYRKKFKATTGVKILQVTSLGCILFATRW